MAALMSLLLDISYSSLHPPLLVALYDHFPQMVAWPECRRDRPPGRSLVSPLQGAVCLIYHQVARRSVHITR